MTQQWSSLFSMATAASPVPPLLVEKLDAMTGQIAELQAQAQQNNELIKEQTLHSANIERMLQLLLGNNTCMKESLTAASSQPLQEADAVAGMNASLPEPAVGNVMCIDAGAASARPLEPQAEDQSDFALIDEEPEEEEAEEETTTAAASDDEEVEAEGEESESEPDLTRGSQKASAACESDRESPRQEPSTFYLVGTWTNWDIMAQSLNDRPVIEIRADAQEVGYNGFRREEFQIVGEHDWSKRFFPAGGNHEEVVPLRPGVSRKAAFESPGTKKGHGRNWAFQGRAGTRFRITFDFENMLVSAHDEAEALE
mmetsp:Transcript_32027/g.75086  ORF Transcript_32027/g.75086 Transcript_32027/m.75086 type:complete len:313 (-) Transcript_32027:44-982(-)